MKTYKGLLTEYFKRNKRLDKIAKSIGRKSILHENSNIFFKIYKDFSKAEAENSELYNYQLRRAYPREGLLF